PGFGNSYRYSLIELISIQFHPAADSFTRTFLQLDKIVLDERRGSLDQLHLTSEPAIVPPIRDQGRHCVARPFVVHLNDEEIASISNSIGDLKIDRRESALVPS